MYVKICRKLEQGSKRSRAFVISFFTNPIPINFLSYGFYVMTFHKFDETQRTSRLKSICTDNNTNRVRNRMPNYTEQHIVDDIIIRTIDCVNILLINRTG